MCRGGKGKKQQPRNEQGGRKEQRKEAERRGRMEEREEEREEERRETEGRHNDASVDRDKN